MVLRNPGLLGPRGRALNQYSIPKMLYILYKYIIYQSNKR